MVSRGRLAQLGGGYGRVSTTARYAHIARDSTQTTALRITGSIGSNLMYDRQRHVDEFTAGHELRHLDVVEATCNVVSRSVGWRPSYRELVRQEDVILPACLVKDAKNR